jgi:ABC-type transport system involved in multi-copper enzyme maturation permease subunit
MPVPAPASKGARGARYGIGGLLRSEWTKIVTVRSTIWTLGVIVVLGIGLSALATWETSSHWSTTPILQQITFDPARTSLIGVFFAQFAMGVLGALVITSEYSTGTIRSTLAAAPRRPLVLVSKAAVFGGVALVVAEGVALVAFLLGQALLSAPTPHTSLSNPEAVRAVLGSGLYLFLLGLSALGIGALVRHTAGAISIFVSLLLILPIIIALLPNSISNSLSRYLPAHIGQEMLSRIGDPHSFSPWNGMLILAGYTIALLIAGGVAMTRRDA